MPTPHRAPAAQRLGPSPSPRTGNRGPQPGADPVLPAGSASARAVAKAHGSPGAAPAPGPPALCNRISPATAGGRRGTRYISESSDEQGVSVHSPAPAGQLGGHGDPTVWGARTLTGVSSSGVEMGEQSPLSLMPLPRSKSQIFTGETWGQRGGSGR